MGSKQLSGLVWTISPCTPQQWADFKRLNLCWLEQYALLEPHDQAILDDPQRYVLNEGGVLFVATIQGEVVGGYGLLPHAGCFAGQTDELIKMAVDPRYQGCGLGKALLQHAIETARQRGSDTLFLETSSKLKSAIGLYQSAGFVQATALQPSSYATADVQMSLSLKRHLPKKSILALIVVCVVWGTTMGSIRMGVETIPPAMLACCRFSLGGLLLILASKLFKKEPWPDWRSLYTHGITGFFLFFMGNAVCSWAVQYLSSGMVSLLVATTPFWMLGLTAALPKRIKKAETVNASAWLTVGICFVGLVILLWPQLSHFKTLSPIISLSIGLVLAVSVFWAMGSLYGKYNPSKASLTMGVGIQNVVAGLCLLPIMLTQVSFEQVHPSARSLWAFAYLVVFGTMLTTPCYFYMLKTMPVAFSSSFAYINPIIALLFGALFLDETLSVNVLWGSVLIIGSIAFLQRFKAKASVASVATAKHPLPQIPVGAIAAGAALKPEAVARPVVSCHHNETEVL